MKRTVLWGARQGDVQYNSRAYWNSHIPVGADFIEVSSSAYFTADNVVRNSRTGELFSVSGIEPGRIGRGGR